jgi:hypothetical protein
MKNLVIVTSYIRTESLSLFTWQERLRDLERTISSIKTKIPDYYIVLAEGSDISVEQLKTLEVDYIYTNQNKFQKSVGELVLLSGYLTSDHFKGQKFKTISKLSGRYTLTDLFDFSEFPLDSFIIKSRDSCIFETRYYRFGADDTPYFLSMVNNSFQDMDKMDIEHAFYKNCNFPKNKLLHPYHIGVVGILAPTGSIVED